MSIDYNHIVGALCIAAGGILLIVSLGDLALRILGGFVAILLINYGLRMQGLPPLQLFIPMVMSRMRRF